MGDIEFMGGVNPKPLKSMNQELKDERDQSLVDQKRFARWGTNSDKRASMMEVSLIELLIRERFPEEA